MFKKKSWKRLLCLLMSILLLSVCPLSVRAYEGMTSSTAEASGGDQRNAEGHSFDENGFCTDCDAYQAPLLVDDVYQIENAGQLYWFAALVNDGVDGLEKNIEANAVLTTHIEVNTGDVAGCGGTIQDGWREWTPIGYGNSRKYSGTFDGGGYTVSGLYYKQTTMNYAGLFGNVYDGSVCNVGVVNSYIHGSNYVGGVCGRVYNSGADTHRTISGCYNTGTVKGSTDSVGGVFGYVQNSGSDAVITVTDCHNTGSVYLTGTSTSGNAGGVCGFVNNSGTNATVTMTECYNEGDVTAAGSSSKRIGGVCGRVDKAILSNCYSLGAVAANGRSSDYVGGVVGYVYKAGAAVENCYSFGSAATPNATNKKVGGVCGYISGGTLTNCYYLTGAAPIGIGSGSGSAEGRTEEQFASGEVAYWLAQGASGIWGQTIGTDETPVLGGKEVLTNCDRSQFANDIIIYGQNASLDGTIGFHVYVAAVDGYEWTASFDGVEAEKPAKDANGLYMFTQGVVAKDMSREFCFSLSNGKTALISVSKYLEVLKTSDDTELAALAEAMDTYGEHAYAFFEGGSAPELPDVTAEDLSGYRFTSAPAPQGIRHFSSSLLLESGTMVRHYFRLAEGQEITSFTFTVDGVEVTPVELQGWYYIDIQDIGAADLGTAHTVAVNGVDVIIGYSAMSYAESVLRKGTAAEELQNVVKALYLYYQAAEAYLR